MPLMDDKGHRGIILESFSKGRKGLYQKFRRVGRLLIACIHTQGTLTLKNVTLIAQPPRTEKDPVDGVQKSHIQSKELCCP